MVSSLTRAKVPTFKIYTIIPTVRTQYNARGFVLITASLLFAPPDPIHSEKHMPHRSSLKCLMIHEPGNFSRSNSACVTQRPQICMLLALMGHQGTWIRRADRRQLTLPLSNTPHGTQFVAIGQNIRGQGELVT